MDHEPGSEPDTAALDTAADGLYALPREEFTPAREERVKRARTEGDRALAGAIGKLRRPTVACWLVNQLARRHPDQLGELAKLGEWLRSAHEQLDGAALRELSGRRRALVTGLVEATRQLGSADGVPVSEATTRELEEMFTSALGDPAAARALASGRLSSPKQLTDAGAHGWPSISPGAAAPRPRLASAPAETEDGAETDERAEATERDTSATGPDGDPADGAKDSPAGGTDTGRREPSGPGPATRRARAEQERTQAALAEAERAHDEASRHFERAAAEESEAHAEVARLRGALSAAERTEQQARQRARFARRQRDDGDRKLREAHRRASLATDRLAALKDAALKDAALKDAALKDAALKDAALKDAALKD